MARSRTKTDKPPIPHWFWAGLFILPSPLIWYLGQPALPCILAGIIIGALTIRYPESKTGRRSDPPDEKDLKRYRKWKDMLAGLKPNRNWKEIWRLNWWGGICLALLCSANAASPLTPLINLPVGFLLSMAWSHYRDRKTDRRHVYTGVSIGSFFKKAKSWKKTIVLILSIGLLLMTIGLWYMAGVSPILVPALPLSALLFSIWVLDKKRQSSQWRDRIKYQQLLDEWTDEETGSMGKPWKDVQLVQVNHVGDKENPLTILRVKPKGGAEKCRKLGVTAIQPSASESGYAFCCLLESKKKAKGETGFDSTALRIVLGTDDTCIPKITDPTTDERLATLVFDIAYAQIARRWNKRAPLTAAHNVADTGNGATSAAWLVQLTLPVEGGELIDNISLNWLGNDPNPGTIVGFPVFADLMDAFHLYAKEDTPLSDKGNKYRPKDIITSNKSFQTYIDLSRRYKTTQTTWQSILGNKPAPPKPMFDQERITNCDGWNVTTLPLEIDPPTTVSDYAKYDLTPLDPTALFIGLIEDGTRMDLIVGNGAAPTRIDKIVGSSTAHRQYAQAMAYHALVNACPAKGTVSITTCSQEGKDSAIWRINFMLGNGATVEDLRRKSANIRSDAGASYVLWDWKTANEATIWMCKERILDPKDVRRWRRPLMQKRFIQLALSDSWGVAGVADKSGRTPDVEQMGVLPTNGKVLKVRFRIPSGLSMKNIEGNQEKFLVDANYQYGRILPRAKDAEDAGLYDMILSRVSPFESMVKADWAEARACDEFTFPLGVNDMGETVYWETKATPHIAIMGKSGTGKSSAAMTVVAEALIHGYDIIIIDPSKGANDFAQWAKPKALTFVGEGQMRETEAAIRWAHEEMSRRVQLLARLGVSNIKDVSEDLRPKRLLIVFDEYNSYISKISKTTPNPNKDLKIANANAVIDSLNNSIRRTVTDMADIAVQGRSAGISMVLGAQRLRTGDFEKFSNGKAFFATLGRMLLGSDSTAGVFSNQRESNRLQTSLKGEGGTIPRGRGLYESADNMLSAVQTWYSGEQSALAEMFSDIPSPTPIDLEPFMPAQAEQFGEVKAEDLPVTIDEEEQTVTEEDIAEAEEVEW